MRFMMLVIPKVYQQNLPKDWQPPADLLAKMGVYNNELRKAGVLLDLNGLTPPAAATRLTWQNGKPRITDGPFAEAKEVVGGYWIIEVKSQQDAIEWARKAPFPDGDTIEVRAIA